MSAAEEEGKEAKEKADSAVEEGSEEAKKAEEEIRPKKPAKSG